MDSPRRTSVSFDDDEYEPFFASDSGSNDDSFSEMHEDIRRKERAELRKLEKQKQRDEQYNVKINKQLDECGDLLKGKMAWVANFNVKEPAGTQFPVSKVDHSKVQPKKFSSNHAGGHASGHASKHFMNERPFEVPVRVGGLTSDVTLYKPEPVVQHSRPQMPNQAPEKTKKIWMCRNVKSCRFGDRCMFAHSVGEIEAAVTKCNYHVCTRVRKLNGRYTNTLNERKCLRLHRNEDIDNFIERTQ